MIVNIAVAQHIEKVVIENPDELRKRFARCYAKTFDSLEAYRMAYADVDSVRASTMLQDLGIWKVIFSEIESKGDVADMEAEWLRSYSLVKEVFGLDPFDLYAAYVLKTADGNTVADALNQDSYNIVMVLAFLYDFFLTIRTSTKGTERKFFLKEIETEYARQTVDKTTKEWKYVIKVLNKNLENPEQLIK